MAREDSEANSTQSHSLTLERGLRILWVLGEHSGGLSVSELADRLGTHRAGVYRLLGPLLKQRLVHRGSDNRYTLGTGLIELATRVRGSLQEVAATELRQLADEIEATTALTIRDEDTAIVAAVREPRNTDMHIAYRAGLRHRLDQAASGIAILASQPPVSGEREAIRQARERGWAVSSGELLAGVTGVGVAIQASGADASISAVWIGDRDEADMACRVSAAAARISAALSGIEPGSSRFASPSSKTERGGGPCLDATTGVARRTG